MPSPPLPFPPAPSQHKEPPINPWQDTLIHASPPVHLTTLSQKQSHLANNLWFGISPPSTNITPTKEKQTTVPCRNTKMRLTPGNQQPDVLTIFFPRNSPKSTDLLPRHQSKLTIPTTLQKLKVIPLPKKNFLHPNLSGRSPPSHL